MTLKLYNTRTRQKELFTPIDPKAVRMYVCGPTVYDFAHIGNARPVIVFDVLFRLLRNLYGAAHVTYARNITDVDDKINARAAEEGIPIRALTERTAAQYRADVAALGCLPPTFEPRATEYVIKPDASEDMIRMIERLIARGHAYEAEGHVLFSVATDPNYGKLARRSVEEMRAGARVEVAPYKRDPMDFVLWKPSSGSEPGWDSPWGFGRPGWHLECSAMSAALLGEVFDIHGGGIDLVFPHHENEVAQSTCAHGTKIMANVWMHNGHLQVEGAKMSKSLGNFVTIHDLLQEWPSEVIRYQMLMTHYRQPLDWTAAMTAQARLALIKFSRQLSGWREIATQANKPNGGLYPPFIDALNDDLNTPEAISTLHALEEEIRTTRHPGSRKEQLVKQLINSFALIGLDGLADFEDRLLASEKAQLAIDEAFVQERIEARLAARKTKNWAEADRIRDELAAMGIALKDAKNPATGEIETTWEIAR
jgi:cysteinyl-tRNA synthetase